MYLTYVHNFGVQTKVTSMKNISNFCDNRSIFTWFTFQTNIKTARQANLKLSDDNILKVVLPEKEDNDNTK